MFAEDDSALARVDEWVLRVLPDGHHLANDQRAHATPSVVLLHFLRSSLRAS